VVAVHVDAAPRSCNPGVPAESGLVAVSRLVQEAFSMAKYLIQGSYTVEGIKGVLKEGGTGRRDAVSAALKPLGGKIESIYYAFGDTDVYVILEAPDNVTAAALAMAVAATGTVGIKTTVLLSIEEIDQAAKKTISYRAAGH
jgi:uncharacterized protein with GYD domain